MEIIELDSRVPELEKFNRQGNESTIYISGSKLYKIFNENVNARLKQQSIEFVNKNKKYLSGIILPVEELSFNGSVIGHTMDFHDIVTVDNFFDDDISYPIRYDYCLKFVDIFNRMNQIHAEYTDFHTDNIFIDKSGNPLLGDCSCIKEKRVGLRAKKEQLSLLLSLLSSVNLVNEANNDLCMSEVIERCGTKELLDYFYNPSDLFDCSLIEKFNGSKEKVDDIVTRYGKL